MKFIEDLEYIIKLVYEGLSVRKEIGSPLFSDY